MLLAVVFIFKSTLVSSIKSEALLLLFHVEMKFSCPRRPLYLFLSCRTAFYRPVRIAPFEKFCSSSILFCRSRLLCEVVELLYRLLVHVPQHHNTRIRNKSLFVNNKH